MAQAEQRKREEEEHKRQENELAFKAWLMKKKEQLQEEKRILRAQEMEKMSSQVREATVAPCWLYGRVQLDLQQMDSDSPGLSVLF